MHFNRIVQALGVAIIAVICSQVAACAAGDLKPFAQNDLKDFYKPLFEYPYGEMFEENKSEKGDPTGGPNLNGHRLGLFTAGIRGLVFYMGMNTCASKFLKEKGKPQFGDLSPLERLSGLKIYSKPANPDNINTFGYYNPAWVRWSTQHLIPYKGDEVHGETFGIIYKKVFSRFFRLMSESYVFSRMKLDLAKERQEYLKAMAMKEFDALTYLERKFGGALGDYFLERNGTRFTPDMAIGFWIRRAADGSDADFWDGLQSIMRQFDKDWFEKLVKDLPAPSALPGKKR